MGAFEDILNQIDAFIKKFYKNQMIKGVLLFFIVFLFSFLLVTGLEYVGRFNSVVRAILLFSFITVNSYILFKYFIIPTSKLFSFGKRINRYQAAKIIGDFFPEVDDRLLNTLQLRDFSESNPPNFAFLQASIQQNSSQLNAFNFSTAIDYSANKRFLKYFVPILTFVILIGAFFPSLFSEGSERLIKYNQVFEIAPDFKFELLNKNLSVEEGNEYTVEVKLIPEPGKALPDKIYIESNEGQYIMKKTANNKASYTFANLNNDLNFHFKANNAQSNSYSIHVVKRTSLGHLSVQIEYPNYIQRATETIENPGDLILPEGTNLSWNGVTKNAKSLKVILGDSVEKFENNPGFRFNHKVFHTSKLWFVLENQEINKLDSSVYHIDIIKDEYPVIYVEKREDSLVKNKIYFNGTVGDDYGVSRLVFTYLIEKENGEKINKNIAVPGINGQKSPFSMTFHLDELGLELKDKVTYFFTVFDNDGINGPKASKSSVYQFLSPSLQELQEQRAKEKDKTSEDLKDLIRQSKDLKEEISRLKKEITNSKNSTWQQQKQVENLQNQLESLQEKINKANEEMKNSFENKSKLDEVDEKLLEKQKLLEEMLENLLDDELKKLLEELQKLLESDSNRDLLEKLEESELSAEQKEKQLDRTLEMLKKMDVQERIEDLQKSLEELAEQQDELREDLANDQNLNKEEAIKEQEELRERFDEIKKDLEEMLERNEALKRPLFFEGLDELFEDISKEMQNASEQMEQNDSQKAQESQQSASEKMEEAAAQLQAQMQKNEQEQQEEDYKALRALIENILRLSFDQENNMVEFKKTDGFDPYYTTLGQDQRRIIDNLKPVKDSLRALAERIPEISSFIEQELKSIDKQYKYIPTHIGEREKPQLATKQQLAMTNYNNLTLFLNEALESAQQQMQGQMEGDGSCDKPGEGKPGKGKKGEGEDGDMEGLKDMIKKQLEQMKNGQPGQDKPGQKPGGLLPINSQQAAKMAAQQNEIQKRLQELKEQLNKDGSGDGNQLNEILKQLEEQQQDLINKNWDLNLINRQQEILTRLLESEKALMERGLDEEREGNTGKDEDFGNQIEFLEYKRQKEKQIELLQTLDPAFSKYYKEKANAFFQQLD